MIQKVKMLIQRTVSLDLRSLALFRILISTILIYDLGDRLRNLTAHYSDQGILPRDLAVSAVSYPWDISLHFISGTWQGMLVLFFLHFLAALCLLFGFRTRVATFFCWVLTLSLHNRNITILHGGDAILKLMLFWGMFLPLGFYYSVDRAMNLLPLKKPMITKYSSLATFAFILQVIFIYVNTAAQKSDPMWTESYHALFYALSGDQLIAPLGKYLLSYKSLLEWLTLGTLLLEFIGPVLLLIPWKNDTWKMGVGLMFIVFHIGIASTMDLGTFPYICIAVWVAMLPGYFWNGLLRTLAANRDPLVVYYDGECQFCYKMIRLLRTFLMLPDLKSNRAQDVKEVHALMERKHSWVVDIKGERFFRAEGLFKLLAASPLWPLPLPRASILRGLDRAYIWVANNRRFLSKATRCMTEHATPLYKMSWRSCVFVGLCLTYVGFLNLATMESYKKAVPKELTWFGDMLGLAQNWAMFAPYPAMVTGWYVMEGSFDDGRTLDLWAGKPVSWAKPQRINLSYRDDRWKSYLMSLYSDRADGYRSRMGDYLCHQWNLERPRKHRLHSVKISFMAEILQRSYKDRLPAEKWMILDWVCSGERPKV